MEEPDVERDIAEYAALEPRRKLLESRLEILNKRIKRKLVAKFGSVKAGQTYADLVRDSSYTYEVSLQAKRPRVEIDQLQLEQVLAERSLFDKCTKRVPDLDLVEQSYIEGDISDDDLRRFKKVGKPQLALSVDRILRDDTWVVD